jgi:UDP-N-acetylglucosamine 2-epimerase (non-hydrolysing)
VSGPWVAVAGTRPNLVKLAPLCAAARRAGRSLRWIHTGQHADDAMGGTSLAADLGLEPPALRLPAPPPGRDRARRMAARLRAPLASLRPSLVVVVGDVDSSVAGALAADALGVPIAHVEAGLRSFEPRMPEERNRVWIDRLADLLHVPEASGRENLLAEGVPPSRVHRDGNVLADALRTALPRLAPPAGEYVVATLHRQANVDVPARLSRFLAALREVARDVEVRFPLHPRTKRRVGRAALGRGVRALPPLPYREFLSLLRGAKAVVTDSGGVQVEASLLGVPCVTARARTEHLLTLSRGTNALSGPRPERIPETLRCVLAAPPRRRAAPREWDGNAGERIVRRWREYNDI